MPDASRPRSAPPEGRCDEAPGRLRPFVDRNRCEAKEACVEVCPYDVFAIRTLTADERRAQSWLGWLKTLAHGGKQAFAVRAEDCHACGLCVEACPEKAIRLARA
jgi:NAD-dependent dihydropyrimidine dehydrogenase PreA subunit